MVEFSNSAVIVTAVVIGILGAAIIVGLVRYFESKKQAGVTVNNPGKRTGRSSNTGTSNQDQPEKPQFPQT